MPKVPEFKKGALVPFVDKGKSLFKAIGVSITALALTFGASSQAKASISVNSDPSNSLREQNDAASNLEASRIRVLYSRKGASSEQMRLAWHTSHYSHSSHSSHSSHTSHYSHYSSRY